MPPVGLKRIIGTSTAMLIGMGVAIGSGIFRTPGDVASSLPSAGTVILCWVVGGLIVLMQGMVTAELATRFPKAGGEYVFLREAYGEFVAFFFGWAYTVFVIGGGAATIAAACGDFLAELLRIGPRWSGVLAAGVIVLVTIINVLGLRTGAWTQNALTSLKIGLLLAIAAVCGLAPAASPDAAVVSAPGNPPVWPGTSAVFGALLAVLWSYEGTTDAVKLAEEIKDVRRAVPVAVIGSTLSLIVLYVAFNAALLNVVPVGEMGRSDEAGLGSVPGEAMRRLLGPVGRDVVLAAGVIICLGSLQSTVLATVRVTFALARDGLTFRWMSRMSRSQAPVPALLVVGVCAITLALSRRFGEVLQIYFFASAILFGLSYASLIVFRAREQRFPDNVYRCPLGRVQAVALIGIFAAIAGNIVIQQPRDAAYTAALLAGFGALYLVWKRIAR